MSDRIERAAVIGGGTMGRGIAQVLATAGIPVALIDRTGPDVDRALGAIESQLDRALAKGAMTADDRDRTLGMIEGSTDFGAAADASIVIEAVFETMEAKAAVFAEIARRLDPSAILASNTSSISITALAATTDMADRVIGMHFFNPVPVMKLIEVVRGLRTSDDTSARTTALAARIGKTPVTVNDFPGFVSNRVLMPMINEAIFCLGEGVASRDAIDEVMKLGMAHPMGPLALADLVGLDVCLAILEVLQREYGDPKFRPAPLLRQYVAAGRLGRKSGEGFYVYSGR